MGNLLSKSKITSSAKSTSVAAEKMTPSPAPGFTHFANAQADFKAPLISPPNHFLGDIATSGPSKPSSAPLLSAHAPITGGFYRLEPGPALVYEYTYDEMKIVVEGEIEVCDVGEASVGQKATAKKGDVFFFPKGCKIRFSTQTGGVGFFVGQRVEGAA